MASFSGNRQENAADLGICIGAGLHVLPELFSTFSGRCPDVRLTVLEGDMVEQVDGLRDGWLDGCLSYLPEDQSGIRRHVLARAPRVMLVSPDDERASAPTLSVADVIDSCWLPADAREPSGWDRFSTLSSERGDPGRRAPGSFAADGHVQCQQVRNGLGNALVPVSAATIAARAGLVAVPVVDATPAAGHPCCSGTTRWRAGCRHERHAVRAPGLRLTLHPSAEAGLPLN